MCLCAEEAEPRIVSVGPDYELTVVLRDYSYQLTDTPDPMPLSTLWVPEDGWNISVKLPANGSGSAEWMRGTLGKCVQEPSLKSLPKDFLETCFGPSLKASLGEPDNDGSVLADIDVSFTQLEGFIEYDTATGSLITPVASAKGIKTRLRMNPGMGVRLGTFTSVSEGYQGDARAAVQRYALFARLTQKKGAPVPPQEKMRYELTVQQFSVEGGTTRQAEFAAVISSPSPYKEEGRLVAETSLTMDAETDGKIFSLQNIPHFDPKNEGAEPKILTTSIGLQFEITQEHPYSEGEFCGKIKFSDVTQDGFIEPENSRWGIQPITAKKSIDSSITLPLDKHVVLSGLAREGKDGKTESMRLVLVLRKIQPPTK